MENLVLNHFHPSQRNEVISLFTQTFSNSEGEAEGRLIGQLVTDLINTTSEQDYIGFVASKESNIIASIFFSRFSTSSQQNILIL